MIDWNRSNSSIKELMDELIKKNVKISVIPNEKLVKEDFINNKPGYVFEFDENNVLNEKKNIIVFHRGDEAYRSPQITTEFFNELLSIHVNEYKKYIHLWTGKISKAFYMEDESVYFSNDFGPENDGEPVYLDNLITLIDTFYRWNQSMRLYDINIEKLSKYNLSFNEMFILETIYQLNEEYSQEDIDIYKELLKKQIKGLQDLPEAEKAKTLEVMYYANLSNKLKDIIDSVNINKLLEEVFNDENSSPFLKESIQKYFPKAINKEDVDWVDVLSNTLHNNCTSYKVELNLNKLVKNLDVQNIYNMYLEMLKKIAPHNVSDAFKSKEFGISSFINACFSGRDTKELYVALEESNNFFGNGLSYREGVGNEPKGRKFRNIMVWADYDITKHGRDLNDVKKEINIKTQEVVEMLNTLSYAEKKEMLSNKENLIIRLEEFCMKKSLERENVKIIPPKLRVKF